MPSLTAARRAAAVADVDPFASSCRERMNRHLAVYFDAPAPAFLQSATAALVSTGGRGSFSLAAGTTGLRRSQLQRVLRRRLSRMRLAGDSGVMSGRRKRAACWHFAAIADAKPVTGPI